MKINFGVNQNFFPNVHRINQNMSMNNSITAKENNGQNKDKISITQQGKASSLIENLMKQKQNIMEQKQNLVDSTLKNGDDIDTIKTQLEHYEEQLKNIDKQISETMAKEVEEQVAKPEKKDDKNPKTEEDVQNERLNNVTNLSNDLTKAKTISSVKSKIDGDARVLSSDIKLDKLRSVSAEQIAKKEEKLAGMEKKSLELISDAGDILADISENIDSKSTTQIIVPKEEDKSDEDSVNSNTYIPNKTDDESNMQNTLQDGK